MAIPLIGAAGAGLAKLTTAIKGLGAAKSLGMNAAYLGKGNLAPAVAKAAPKVAEAANKGVRYAGLNMTDNAGILDRIKRGLTSREGFATNYGRPMGQDLGLAFAPDLLFGGMTALMSPGDVGDKLLAGAGTAIGGAAGGLGARGVFGPRSDMGRMMAELGGGIAGDMVGMKAADALIRAKNGGTTPYEKQAAVDMEELRQQIIADYIRNGQ